MKINKIEFFFKIFFLMFLIGSSDCFKTSFGLLKKSNKKSNTNNNSENLYKTNNQNKAKQDPQLQTNPPAQPTTPQIQTGPGEVIPAGNSNILTLPDQPIYAQGWIKYLHYDDAGKKKAKKFWKNTLFQQEQRIKDENTAPSSDEVIIMFYVI